VQIWLWKTVVTYKAVLRSVELHAWHVFAELWYNLIAGMQQMSNNFVRCLFSKILYFTRQLLTFENASADANIRFLEETIHNT